MYECDASVVCKNELPTFYSGDYTVFYLLRSGPLSGLTLLILPERSD